MFLFPIPFLVSISAFLFPAFPYGPQIVSAWSADVHMLKQTGNFLTDVLWFADVHMLKQVISSQMFSGLQMFTC